MTSYDAEQKEAKKKGGKDGQITREAGRKIGTTACQRFNK